MPSRAEAAALDAADALRPLREAFLIPHRNGVEQLYFCGNSLGLQPRGVRAAVREAMEQWARQEAGSRFRGQSQWLPYPERVREPLARVAGALPGEVAAMNSLTANLHLMMVSFYRPTPERPAVLIEAGAFGSDRYAVESQIRFHGLDPAHALIELEADEPDGTLSMAAIERAIGEHGPRLALVLWPGVQFRSGQAFALGEIARLAHAQGALAGFDLAHAIGNLPLELHDDDADFAVWCHYKYMNAGPGAVAGCFVHERHATTARPRFAGGWGQQRDTRFMPQPVFAPAPGAEGWQLSNPPTLAIAPLQASLALFEQAGMQALREKSRQLTGFLERCIQARLAHLLRIVTPSEPERRGCQLSLRVLGGRERGRALFEYLASVGMVVDWREPDVLRVAPAPLYNRHIDVYRLIEEIETWGMAW